MQAEHNRVGTVIIDTVTLLCKSSFSYANQLKIEGVIGVTVDGCIFLVHIDQHFGPNDVSEATSLQSGSSSRVIPSGIQIKSEPSLQTKVTRGMPADEQAFRHIRFENSNANVKVEPVVVKQETGIPNDAMARGVLPVHGNNASYDDSVISILEDYGDGEETSYSAQESFDDLTHYQTQEGPANQWGACNVSTRPPTRRARGGRRGTRPSRASSHAARNMRGEGMVITESSHICGYPGCFKRFKFKHDLLRHQTKKHGRKPAFTRNRQQVEGDGFASGSQDGYYEDENFELYDYGSYDYDC